MFIMIFIESSVNTSLQYVTGPEMDWTGIYTNKHLLIY